MKNPAFTFEAAFALQKDHMAEWELVLKPEIAAEVNKRIGDRNAAGYNDPYEVCRGDSITQIVYNVRQDLQYGRLTLSAK
jgi:hypothetical protein